MTFLAVLVLALAPPAPSGGRQGHCIAAYEHGALVYGATLDESVGHELAKVRLALASAHRRVPWIPVGFAERALRSTQRLFVVRARNLRHRAAAIPLRKRSCPRGSPSR